MAKVYVSRNENVSDLFPADNIRENAESHHPEHHGNEIDCLGVKAYCGGRYWSWTSFPYYWKFTSKSSQLSKGPNDQLTKGPNDQLTEGSNDQMTKGPNDQETK